MLIMPSKGTSIITTSERMINDTLMMLACRPTPPSREDLIDVLEEIADFRWGDPPYPRPAGFYSGPLYWEVFQADPVGNTQYRMERLKKRFHHLWIDCDGQLMADALRKFHCDFAYGCESGDMNRMAVCGLINAFLEQCRGHS